MLIRTRLVFYGEDCLPYKDFERKVHYPIIDPSFQGASQTDQIKFYVDQIGGSDITWVAVAKLPNGKIITKLLETSSDENGTYALLEMSNQFTQVMGNVFISLKGYAGGTEIVYDDESEIYVAQGNPIIQATGSVQINIRYATPIDESEEDYTYQELLALISGKIDKNSLKYIKVVSTISDINSEDYEQYIASGSIVYAQDTKLFYIVSGSYPTFTYRQLSFDYIPLKTADSSTTLNDICQLQSRTFCFVKYDNEIYYFDAWYQGEKYICYAQKLRSFELYGGNILGTTTFANFLETTFIEEYLDQKSNQDILGQKTVTDGGRIIIDSTGFFNLYNSKITTNAKGYFARVGVTTGQYVDYSLPYDYIDNKGQSFTLATQSYVDEQINLIEMQSDVIDVVGTYADLQAYDTTNVKENDLIKVITDSTHNNATSYYRWENGAWVYVASEGPYYTTSQVDNLFVTKTTQIAGLQINDGITAQALTDVLVLANNIDIDNLF